LNITKLEVLIAIKKKDYMQYPQLMKGDTWNTNPKKYWLFHKNKGHDIKKCYTLKKWIREAYR
jgi:hypothetical protein